MLIRGLGPDLHQRLMKARNQVRLHSSNYDEFADALDPVQVQVWTYLSHSYIVLTI